ncbi:MAG: hypothetical protein GPJ54_20995, partial [Candidatus Heimdallarchaeota archaeon]|nr:hypothetical protein [Candidatus Heimdallarchaeota archaeon]
TSKIVEFATGDKIAAIAWFASALIMTSTLIMRFYSIDLEKFTTIIQETNPVDYELSPKKFLDWITIAMVVGLFATVTIHYNFIAGMLVYLLMQLSLIKAFSGIFVINPKIAFTDPALKRYSTISAIFWIFYVAIVYTVFVYNGSESLIVVPYIIFLGVMAHISWYGLSYDRSPLFKYMMIAASAIFVFSDSLIGNDVYGETKLPEDLYHTIDMTYVLNIFLMSQAVLFLKDKAGQSALKL